MSRATSATRSASFVAQPFAYFVAIDEKNSTQYLGTVYQTGLGMPDRDYYLSDDAQLKGMREKYRVYVQGSARRRRNAGCGRLPRKKIFALETRLATAHWTRVQNRDAEKTYNRYDRAALAQADAGVRLERILRRRADPGAKVAGAERRRSRATSRRSTR